MRIEIIAIGDEVVNGYTVNSNGSFIANELLEAGFSPTLHMAIGDAPIQMKEELKYALARADVVITTGGLGPTCDDHTKQVAAEIFQRPLETSLVVSEYLKNTFGHDLVSLEDQSLQPKGAELFKNSLGTAWGFALESKSTLIALPGVPSERRAMFLQVKEYLQRKYTNTSRLYSSVFHFLDVYEVQIDPLLRAIEREFPKVHCGIYPAFGEVTVRFMVEASSQEEAFLLFKKPQEKLLEQFGSKRYESASGRLDEAVHNKLLQKNVKVATGESCTAGALAASLTAYPDSSKYFLGGVVSYANEVKKKLLAVDSRSLEEKGAVSIEVATQMAENALSLFMSDIAISVSGILGPSGGTAEKPVGTVCAALAIKGQPTYAWTMHLQGNRASIREKAIQQILAVLYFKV
jgi:nicotinamide-nucleotide amidase